MPVAILKYVLPHHLILVDLTTTGLQNSCWQAQLARAYATAKIARMEMPGNVHETAVSAPMIEIGLEEYRAR